MLIYDDTQFDDAQVSVKCPKLVLSGIYMGKKDAVKENAVINGDATKFDLILDNMNSFSVTDDVYFNIIEP